MSDRLPGEDLPPLHQLTQEEFRDLTRPLCPMTDEEFDAAWEEFQEIKRRREMN